MAIFELDFELSGLKVKIKSDREDAPHALNAVQQQIGGLLQTAAGLGTANGLPQSNGATNQTRVLEASVPNQPQEESRSKGSRSKRNRTAVSAPPVGYSHTQDLGHPKQGWNTARKAMWMLSILEKATDRNEFSTGELAATFNKNFKQFGPVTTTNVTRDLGKERVKGFVSSDASKDPQTWFLLDGGKKEVLKFLTLNDGEKA